MAFFKKINRGVILLVVLILAVSGYLTALHFIHITDRAQIKQTVQDYVEVLQKDMPLGDRSVKDALAAAKSNQLGYFSGDEAAAPTFARLESIYESQEQFGAMSEAEITLMKVTSYIFDGNTAQIMTQMNMKLTDCPVEIFGMSDDGIYTVQASFVLQKDGGEWRLFYYDLDLGNTGNTIMF